MARDFELDIQAARARYEAIVGARRARSLLMTDDPKLTLEYLALTDLPAALKALEEAQEALRAVRERAKQGRKIMERDIYLFAGDILTILGESE